MQGILIGLLAHPLPPALAIESEKAAQQIKRIVHAPASRSDPAAEAASIRRLEQVSHLSRAR
jgi:hypothetical protein